MLIMMPRRLKTGKYCGKFKPGVNLHEAYNGCYLDRRKDKLSFAISFHSKEVDTEDEKEEKDDENRLCGIWVPVIRRKRARDNLKW